LTLVNRKNHSTNQPINQSTNKQIPRKLGMTKNYRLFEWGTNEKSFFK